MTRSDDEVAAALRALRGAPADDAAALERLHGRIMAGAEPGLRARRVVRRRGGVLAIAGSWSRAAVPIGIAASFAAGVMLTRMQPVAEVAPETPVTLFAAATGSVRGTQLMESAVETPAPEALLYQTVPQ